MKLTCNSCDGVYSDSLDVRFTKRCSNNCPWCIERRGIADLGRPDPLVLASATVLSGKRTVLILGGEPFLEVTALAEYVELIRPKVDKIYVTTSVPRTLDLTNVDVHRALRAIDGLNVSLHSVDWRENNVILQSSDANFNRVARLGEVLAQYGPKVRVSVNLAANGVNSRASVLAYVNALAVMNCVSVKLNELQDAPDAYVSFDELFPEIALGSPYASGCQTPVDIGQPACVTVVVKRSCFIVGPAVAVLGDLVKAVYRRIAGRSHTTVLYENGDLSDGWLIGGDER